MKKSIHPIRAFSVIAVLIVALVAGVISSARVGARERIRERIKDKVEQKQGEILRIEGILLKPLALYPPEMRIAILEVASHPELMGQIAANPAQFTHVSAAAAKYPQSTREAAQKVAAYPAVINVLNNYPGYASLIGAIYAKKPAEVEKYVLSLDCRKIAQEESGASPSGPSETGTGCPDGESTTSAIECFYENPVVAQELAALQQTCASTYPAYSACTGYEAMTAYFLADEALTLYALNHCSTYPYLTMAACQYATYYPLPVVDQWYHAMSSTYNVNINNYNDISAYVETLNVLQQYPQLSYQSLESFLTSPDVQKMVLAAHEKYPQLTSQMLQASQKTPSAVVDQWKGAMEKQYGLKCDSQNLQSFAEQTSLNKKYPQYQGKSLTDAGKSAEVLNHYQQYPKSTQEILKNSSRPSNAAQWENAHQNLSGQLKNPSKQQSLKTFSSSSAYKSNPAAKSLGAPQINAKSLNINNAASLHSKSWAGASKMQGMPKPGGGAKPKMH